MNNNKEPLAKNITSYFLSLSPEVRGKIVIIISVLCVVLGSFYWFSYRTTEIKKECATTATYSSREYSNSEYNEIVEKQKRQQLGEYIQCRNNNLVEGNRLDVSPESIRSFTRDQYETLSLSDLVVRVLGTRPSMLYTVYFDGYTGGSITNGWYSQLEDNKDKYPRCNFPQGFVQEKIFESNSGLRDASDKEYRACLRKKGIDN